MHFRKTLNLAIPLALGQLMSIGINTADIIAMGQLGTHELAAGSLAARYFQPFFFMGMGLMLAVGPLVAQGLGGNDDHLVRSAFRQGLFLAVAVGLVFILPIAGGHTVLIWLGQDADILAYVDNFLLWLAVGIPFVFIYFVARQYVISHQRPIPQVVAAALGLGANIIANHLLINGVGPFPAMGLNGIALSTSVIYLLMGGGLLFISTLACPIVHCTFSTYLDDGLADYLAHVENWHANWSNDCGRNRHVYRSGTDDWIVWHGATGGIGHCKPGSRGCLHDSASNWTSLFGQGRPFCRGQ